MDFKWAMQERIDAGMNEMDAYYDTRDSYAAFSDNRDKCKGNGCDCNCTCDNDCECKMPVNEGPVGLAAFASMRYS